MPRALLFALTPIASLCALFAIGCECAPVSAPTTCEFDSDCTSAGAPRCAQGRCRAACREPRDCDPGEECVFLETGSACVPEAQLECRDDADCTNGLACHETVCRQPCESTADCCTGAACSDVVCERLGSDSFCRRIAPEPGPDGGAMDGSIADASRDATSPDASSPDAGRDASLPDAARRDGSTGTCHGPGCDPVIDLALGEAHACVATASGAVWCWGRNAGTESTGTGVHVDGPCVRERCMPTPYHVLLSSEAGVEQAVEVDVGDTFSCARLASGRVQCWGFNAGLGVLGREITASVGATGYVEVLADRTFLTGVAELAVGRSHVLVRTSSGELMGWGRGEYGELGEPRVYAADGARHVDVPTVGSIAGAFRASCATRSGVVECRGNNTSLTLGRTLASGTDTTLAAPIELAVTDFDQLAAGAEHVCGHTSGGRVFCWGGFLDPQLPHEIVIAAGDAFHSVASGAGATAAVCGVAGADRHVRCWGRASSDAFYPVGTDTSRPVAMYRTELHDIVEVATDGGTGCALDDLGDVMCWGDDTLAQLGRGTFGSPREPAAVVWPE